MAAETPQVAGIYQDIESHPPLMQAEARRKYRGQAIEWLLTFVSGSVDQGKAQLAFRSEPRLSGPLAGIWGDVALSEYPWLKTLPAETPLRVKARIKKVDGLAMTLDILELSLPEPAMESQK